MNAPDYTTLFHIERPMADLRPTYEQSVLRAARLLWRRRLLIATATVTITAAAMGVAAMLPKSYVGEALIRLTFNSEANAQGSAPTVTVDGASMVESEAEILRSRSIARRVLNRLDKADAARKSNPSITTVPDSVTVRNAEPGDVQDGRSNLDQKLYDLRKGLTVKNDGKNYLLSIVYMASSPARAAVIANLFADEYLTSRIEASAAAARGTGDWLEMQVKQAELELSKADAAAREFRMRTEVVAANVGQSKVRDQQMQDVLAQVSASKAEVLRLRSRLERLDEAIRSASIPSLSDLQGSPDIQKIIDAEVQTRQEAARLAKMLGTKHPLYIGSERAHDAALAQLTAAIATSEDITRKDLRSAQGNLDDLSSQLSNLKAVVASEEALDRTLRDLDARSTSARTNLDRLRDALRQSLALAEFKPTNAQLASAADPIAIPTSPNMRVILILSGISGLLAGFALVFLLELRDGGFVSAEQTTTALGLPFAGLIPAAADDKPGEARARAQALKALIIRVGLAAPRDGCVVVVTSATTGEGKSAFVRDLAIALTGTGRQVLVASGRSHGFERLPIEQAGPTSVSVDLQQIPDDRASTSGWAPSPGSVQDASDVLVCSSGIEPWIESARAQFDVVIIESPGTLIEPESVAFAQAADVVLFVARWNSTPRRVVQAGAMQLIPAPGQKTSVVLTDVDLQAHKKMGLRDHLHFSLKYGAADN